MNWTVCMYIEKYWEISLVAPLQGSELKDPMSVAELGARWLPPILAQCGDILKCMKMIENVWKLMDADGDNLLQRADWRCRTCSLWNDVECTCWNARLLHVPSRNSKPRDLPCCRFLITNSPNPRMNFHSRLIHPCLPIRFELDHSLNLQSTGWQSAAACPLARSMCTDSQKCFGQSHVKLDHVGNL